jgi:hypothetical protein
MALSQGFIHFGQRTSDQRDVVGYEASGLDPEDTEQVCVLRYQSWEARAFVGFPPELD